MNIDIFNQPDIKSENIVMTKLHKNDTHTVESYLHQYHKIIKLYFIVILEFMNAILLPTHTVFVLPAFFVVCFICFYIQTSILF